MIQRAPNTYPIKSLLLGGIIFIAGAGFWFFFKEAVAFGDLEVLPVFFSVITLTCFLIALSLLLLFAEHFWLLGIPFLLSVTSFAYFFGFSFLIAGGISLAVAGIFRAYTRVRAEAENRINFRIPILLREGLPTILTAYSLLLAIAYYTETHLTPERVTLRDILPRALFETVLERAPSSFGKTILPEFNSSLTLDAYLTRALEKNGVVFSTLPLAEQAHILEEARKRLFMPLTDKETGIQNIPDGSVRLGDVLYDIVAQKSEQFLAPYEQFFPIGFAVAFFLFLRTVALPFSWILIWICAGLVYLARISGFVVRIEEQTTKERITWS